MASYAAMFSWLPRPLWHSRLRGDSTLPADIQTQQQTTAKQIIHKRTMGESALVERKSLARVGCIRSGVCACGLCVCARECERAGAHP